jgi:hypothetical protein
VLVLIVITMQGFALFVQIDVMTNGGPLDSTQTCWSSRPSSAATSGRTSPAAPPSRSAVPDRPRHLADPALAHEGAMD